MSQSISSAKNGPVLTKGWLITVGILLLAALIGGAVWILQKTNEPPIRVRNGSLQIDLDQGKWTDLSDGWGPSLGDASDHYDVLVLTGNGYKCTKGPVGNGNKIDIEFLEKDDKKFSINFAIGNKKTKLRPRDTFNNGMASRLEHGDLGLGHISKITVKGGTQDVDCDFADSGQLTEIRICVPGHPVCKP
jgi:hypothetical protein